MPIRPSAADVWEREFLDLRAKLVQMAAALDRIERQGGLADDSDPRRKQIRQALDVLSSEEGDRAERIQLAFSLPYDRDWRDRFGILAAP